MFIVIKGHLRALCIRVDAADDAALELRKPVDGAELGIISEVLVQRNGPEIEGTMQVWIDEGESGDEGDSDDDADQRHILRFVDRPEDEGGAVVCVEKDCTGSVTGKGPQCAGGTALPREFHAGEEFGGRFIRSSCNEAVLITREGDVYSFPSDGVSIYGDEDQAFIAKFMRADWPG